LTHYNDGTEVVQQEQASGKAELQLTSSKKFLRKVDNAHDDMQRSQQSQQQHAAHAHMGALRQSHGSSHIVRPEGVYPPRGRS
jgi:hypothetical protein